MRRELVRENVTVRAGELAEFLASIPPETHVLVATDWWGNVESVIWDPDDGLLGVTLFPADDFDGRQF